VPTNQEFLDIVLSRTQRQLPTQIRAGFKISRIRGILLSIFQQSPTSMETDKKKRRFGRSGYR
jgi:GTP1/Obg family GTP-binding protein